MDVSTFGYLNDNNSVHKTEFEARLYYGYMNKVYYLGCKGGSTEYTIDEITHGRVYSQLY